MKPTSARTRSRLGLEHLEDRTTPATLVAEINPATLPADPVQLTDVNGTLFFFADNGQTGRELWKSDGTAAGTTLVKDINPGSAPSVVDYYEGIKPTVLNGVLYFAASDGVNGQELWRSDGTAAGTFMVKNVSEGISLSGPIDTVVATGNRVYFTSWSGTSGKELFVSDGTAAGTFMVKDIATGAYNGSNPAQLTAVGNTLYFTANAPGSGIELWKSNGTAAGTVLVKELTPGVNHSYLSNLTAAGGQLFFTFNDGATGVELWKSNGTAAGTVLVKDIYAGTSQYGSINSSSPSGLTNVGGTLYFAATDGTSGRELWKSDGTAAGTVLVSDINPTGTGGSFPSSSSPSNLIAGPGGNVYFTANGPSGNEVYRSNGTAAGTVLVTDLAPGAGSSNPQQLTRVGGQVYFTTTDYTNPTKLYRTNGTAGGTVFVDTINPGYGARPTASGGKLFFVETNPLTGNELSVSTGTAAGTGNIVDLNATPSGSQPRDITVFDGSVFFVADSPTEGTELWVINQDGLMQVTNVPGATGAQPFNLFVAGNRLWFMAYTDYNQGSIPAVYSTNSYGDDTELVYDFAYDQDLGGLINQYSVLYYSDVTVIDDIGYLTIAVYDTSYDYDLAGTFLYAIDAPQYDVYLADQAFDIQVLGEFNGELHYGKQGGYGASNGADLWRLANGVTATPVADLSATTSVRIYDLQEFNGKLYISAIADYALGAELYVTDGTQAGTGLVADLNPGNGSSYPSNFTVVGDNLFFTATGATGGEELYKVDLSGAATLVKDINPGTASSGISNLTAVGGLLYFSASDGASGQELWVSDGTAAGTVRVADLNSGAAGSNPAGLTDVNGTLYFVATGASGRELYKLVNGAPVLVADINPGAASGFDAGQYAAPPQLTFDPVSGTLYFAADNGETGLELFAIEV